MSSSDEKVVPDSDSESAGGHGSRPADAFSKSLLLSALHVDGAEAIEDDERDSSFVDAGRADVEEARGGFLLWSCVWVMSLGRFIVATW